MRISAGALAALPLAALLCLPAQARRGKRKMAGQKTEYTIQETFKKNFDLKKPPFPLGLPSTSLWPVQNVASQEILGGRPAELDGTLLNALGFPASERTARPWLPEIPHSPVARFKFDVPQNYDVRRWELQIFDSHGLMVSSRRGKGLPPEEIIWDGKTNTGHPIQVGLTYAYKLQLIDRQGNAQSFLGSSFRLPALQYQRGERQIIEIPLADLFIRRKPYLTSQGKDYLARALEIITQERGEKQWFLLYDNSEQSLIQRRLRALTSFIAEELQTSPEKVALQPAPPVGRGKILRIEFSR